jgi:hypothetical protein
MILKGFGEGQKIKGVLGLLQIQAIRTKPESQNRRPDAYFLTRSRE